MQSLKMIMVIILIDKTEIIVQQVLKWHVRYDKNFVLENTHIQCAHLKRERDILKSLEG